MTRLTVTLEGLAELLRNLRRLDDALAEEALATAVERGGLVVEKAAKERVPVKTGTLRRSIHTEVTERGPYRAVATVGTNLEYAEAVEFGTGVYSEHPESDKQPIEIRPKTKKALFWKGAEHPVKRVVQQGQRPRPYLRPALDENREAVREEIRKTLRREIEKAVR